MQTESSARLARLEQLIDKKQAENDQLKDELEQRIADLQAENAELRRATWHLIHNTMDLLAGIKRQVENEEQRLEKILGRPVAKGSRIIDELIKDRERERATS